MWPVVLMRLWWQGRPDWLGTGHALDVVSGRRGVDDPSRPQDEELFEVLADLEAHAETLNHFVREAEVADRGRAEYQDVTLDARLMASVGSPVVLTVRGVGTVRGVLTRVGEAWCQVEGGHLGWTLRSSALVTVRGLSARAVPRMAWSRLDAVGVRSPLRRHADAGTPCDFLMVDGTRVTGRVARVGADFVEVDADAPGAGGEAEVVLPLAALAAVRSPL